MKPLTSAYVLSDRPGARADPTPVATNEVHLAGGATAPREAVTDLTSAPRDAGPPHEGPFFHGTVADLRPGDLLTAGRPSNYRPEILMNHVYFTAVVDGAGLAAEIAAELSKTGRAPRVYSVEPTGMFEDDSNVTNKRFPGNPTRSYRSREPLRVLSEVTTWTRLTSDELKSWRDRLAVLLGRDDGGGLIIN